MAAVSPATVEDAYQHYATSKQPSYSQTAEAFGVSLRLVQEWATAGKWQERYQGDQSRLVATMRYNSERAIDDALPQIVANTIDLALNARSESVRLDASKHLMALRGLAVTHKQQSVSVVQHVRSGASSIIGSGDVVSDFRDALSAFVSIDAPPLPPGDYREEREEEDGRVPTTDGEGNETNGPTNEHGGDGETDDGSIIEGMVRE